MPQNGDLTFQEFQKINRQRCRGAFPTCKTWTIEQWALALAGEAGELCNIIKKFNRGDYTLAQARPEILKELADIMTYADLAISDLGGETDSVLMHEFDEVSARVGWVRPRTGWVRPRTGGDCF